MLTLKKVRGKGGVVANMPLALGEEKHLKGLKNYGSRTAADARTYLGLHRARFAGIVGQAQETVQPGQPGFGDSLCGDWGLFSRIAAVDRRLASVMLLDRLQDFMSAPERVQKRLVALGQEYTTKGDFPAEVLDTIEKYHVGIEEIDVGWRKVFDVKDFTGTKKNGFKIRDVQSGLTFRRVPTGDSVDVYKMQGTEAEVTFARYGGALGWDRTWFEDEEFWQVSDTAIEFRNKFYNDMADVHYALVEAIGAGINVAHQPPTPAGLAVTDPLYELIRDIQTMNLAALQIVLALDNQGMGVTANTRFGLLAPLTARSRIDKALAMTYNIPGLRNPAKVTYAIEPHYTTRLASTTQYYIYLPGKKSKSGIRKNLETFAEFDILSYSDVTAGWGRYGAGIGETNQFRRCLM